MEIFLSVFPNNLTITQWRHQSSAYFMSMEVGTSGLEKPGGGTEGRINVDSSRARQKSIPGGRGDRCVMEIWSLFEKSGSTPVIFPVLDEVTLGPVKPLADPEGQRARALRGGFQKGTLISENSSDFASLRSKK